MAETDDGFLNDINGLHINPERVFAAAAEAAILLCLGPSPVSVELLNEVC